MTVSVVRHAETYKNVFRLPKIPEEKLDSLTPKGTQQAKKAAVYLKGKNVVAISGENGHLVLAKGAVEGQP